MVLGRRSSDCDLGISKCRHQDTASGTIRLRRSTATKAMLDQRSSSTSREGDDEHRHCYYTERSPDIFFFGGTQTVRVSIIDRQLNNGSAPQRAMPVC